MNDEAMIDYAKYARIFKVMSNPKRLKIIDMLSEGELCACKILEEFHITQPTLSHDMKVMCDLGIVKARKEGKWMQYSLDIEVLNDVYKTVGRLMIPGAYAGLLNCNCNTERKNEKMNQIKLYFLTVFWSGKTTLLKNLLENMEGTKVGVIQNELGKISIDGTVLQNDDIHMVELNRGSIFCSCLRLSFVDALAKMSQQGLEYVFVESSGFGDPSNAEEILEATKVLVGEVYDFRGCICLVDCYNFLDQLEDEITIDRQLKHCNLAVLTKVDLVDREKIELIKEKVQEINPVCPITESENGNIKRSFYDMDLMKYQWAECEETTNSAETKPKTFSMNFAGEIEKDKLEAFLERIEPSVYRAKGFFKVKNEGWEKVDVVGKKLDYAPYEEQEKSELVFISKIGIALIREIKEAWDEYVGLPMKLNN